MKVLKGRPNRDHGVQQGAMWSALAVLLAYTVVAGCAPRQLGSGPASAPPEYIALPDTLVCVVDRGASAGLREIPAKVGSAGVVLFSDGQIQPLEALHPINVIAGYAGREAWLTRGETIPFEGQAYQRYLGERRIAPNLLRRVGEYQGILLFTGAATAPPVDVLYVPTAPGCIFQPFARADVVNR